jgi:penicillin-binding protein 2
LFREQDRTRLTGRTWFFYLLATIAFLVLSAKAWYLQVATGEDYLSRSQANSLRMLEEVPSRGLIVDRQGQIIVDNRPAFALAVLPTEIPDSLLQRLCRFVDVEFDELKSKMRRANRYRPFVIKRFIDDSLRIHLAENQFFYPGVIITADAKRFYPPPQIMPHVLGYIGEAAEKQLMLRAYLEPGDIVGKTGLEAQYDEQLRGEKGLRYVRVDVSGREVGEIRQKRILPHAAQRLMLSIDRDLQAFSESLLDTLRGAVVALDPRNGEVLVMASKPDFAIDLFTEKISPQEWQKLLNDPNKPLTHRAVQGVYPPGSTYKMVSAVLARDKDIVSLRWQVNCPGHFRIGRKTMYCWNLDGHGDMQMLDALRHSCNVYFYQLSRRLQLSDYSDYSRRFYFGQVTGIDLPGEHRGLVPTAEFYERRLGPNGFTAGHLANLVIGQGEILATPLQVAQYAMILANKGTFYRPHLLRAWIDEETNDTLYYAPQATTIDIPTASLEIARRGMYQVVHGGTASSVALIDIAVAGKTGTAQNPHGESHSWFICYAPADSPQIAMAVIAENAGGGSVVAAPIARQIIEQYFFGSVDYAHRLYKPQARKETDSLQLHLRIEPLITE